MKNFRILENDTSNNNNNKEDNTKCDIFSIFGVYVQITLAILSFLILFCKK